MRRTTIAYYLIPLMAAALLLACGDDEFVSTPDAALELGVDLSFPDQKPKPDQPPKPDQWLPPDHGPDTVPHPDQLVVDQGPDLLASPDGSAIPTGSGCKAPNKLTLVTGGTKTVTGTTKNAANEFSAGVNCGTGYTFDGAQVYYQMTLEALKTYKVQVTPNGWDAALYMFWDKACGLSNINTQCKDLVADNIQGKGAETLYVSPSTTRDYLLAVDTFSATKSGPYTLTVEDFIPAVNSVCNKATAVTFTGTKVTINGDTSSKALNEYAKDVSCGGGSALEGPQLYYKVSLIGAKAYRLKLKPTGFAAQMYIFPASVCGIGTIIDTACKSKGKTGHFSGPVAAGSTKELIFKPSNSGDFVIAVDSTSMAAAGAFTLELEQAALPAYDACAKAKTVPLSGGKATVSGTTELASNGIALTSSQCTKTATAGADLFYGFTVTGGRTYKVTLTPDKDFDPALYVFTACSSAGSTCLAGVDSGYSGGVETIKFTAAATATYLVAVDSRHAVGSSYAQGSFSLTVEEFTKPSNDTCAKPKTMAWSSGKATVIGDTFYSQDQYATVSCGSKLKFDGPQLYYKVALTSGKKYLATLTPSNAYDAAMYAFPASTSCSAAAISSACKGRWTDSGSKGAVETLMISPGSSGSWILAADSWDKNAYGTFTMSVQELNTPTNNTCAAASALTFPTGASKLTVKGFTYAATNSVALTKSDCTKNATSGPDVFYQLKLDQGKTYKLKLDGSGYNASLYLFTSCSYVSSTCGAGMGSDGSTTAAESITLKPSATLNYYIGVDGRGAADSGPYTLTVERLLLACDVAKKLTFSSGGVATGTGDTATGANTVELPASGCASKVTAGLEHIYAVDLTGGQSYTVKVTPSSGYDPVLYALSNCKQPKTSCTAGADTGGKGQAETLTLKPATSGTYYVVVDAAKISEYGPYILEIK